MSSEILGHDCDGKPLRAGDRVILVDKWYPLKPGMAGKRGTVIGLEQDPLILTMVALSGIARPMIEYREDGGELRTGADRSFRIIPQQDLGDWSEIHKQTGWKPGKEERRETEKTT